MPYVITNEVAFRGYRHTVTTGIGEYRNRPLSVPMLAGYIGAQFGVPMPLAAGEIPEACALALATWLFRYMRRTFVNYLRTAFRWGGFPGWEQYENPPTKELAALTEGLLPL